MNEIVSSSGPNLRAAVSSSSVEIKGQGQISFLPAVFLHFLRGRTDKQTQQTSLETILASPDCLALSA